MENISTPWDLFTPTLIYFPFTLEKTLSAVTHRFLILALWTWGESQTRFRTRFVYRLRLRKVAAWGSGQTPCDPAREPGTEIMAVPRAPHQKKNLKNHNATEHNQAQSANTGRKCAYILRREGRIEGTQNGLHSFLRLFCSFSLTSVQNELVHCWVWCLKKSSESAVVVVVCLYIYIFFF